MNFNEFLQWEQSSRDTIDFKKIYVDMVLDPEKPEETDPLTGLLLSEIVYWYLPGHDGNGKLRVIHEGFGWICVKRYEWWDRCRMSPRQADRSINKLVELGILVKDVFKFNGDPTTHIRINEDRFLRLLEYARSHPRVNPFSPTSENQITYRGVPVTETTTETTDSSPSAALPGDLHPPIGAFEPLDTHFGEEPPEGYDPQETIVGMNYEAARAKAALREEEAQKRSAPQTLSGESLINHELTIYCKTLFKMTTLSKGVAKRLGEPFSYIPEDLGEFVKTQSLCWHWDHTPGFDEFCKERLGQGKAAGYRPADILANIQNFGKTMGSWKGWLAWKTDHIELTTALDDTSDEPEVVDGSGLTPDWS